MLGLFTIFFSAMNLNLSSQHCSNMLWENSYPRKCFDCGKGNTPWITFILNVLETLDMIGDFTTSTRRNIKFLDMPYLFSFVLKTKLSLCNKRHQVSGHAIFVQFCPENKAVFVQQETSSFWTSHICYVLSCKQSCNCVKLLSSTESCFN
jgi:hypothetical protein